MKEKRKPVRFGVLDVFVIVAVITVLIGAFGRMYIAKRNGISNADKATVTYLVEGISPEAAKNIHVGDKIVLNEYDESGAVIKSTEFGTVGTVSAEPSLLLIERGGETFDVNDPEKVDLRCWCAVSGKNTSGGFMLGGTHYLAAGMSVTLEGPRYTMTALIVDVSPVNPGT